MGKGIRKKRLQREDGPLWSDRPVKNLVNERNWCLQHTHTQRLVRKQLRMNKSHKSEITPPELLGSAVCEHERANPTVAVSKTE